MQERSLRRTTGVLLVVVPILFTVCFTLLQQMFEYPDILRQPTADILAKFDDGGRPLIAVWYVLTLTALAFIPVVLLVHRVFAAREASALLPIATAFGVLAGVTQTLGFLRWPLLVPELTRAYLDPSASASQREVTASVFEAFHRYLGVGVGEHLGYLSTSVWTLLIAIIVLRTNALPRWAGVSGIVLAFGIGAGLTEPAGSDLGGTINAISYLVWALWLVAVGVTLLLPSGARSAQASSAPALERSRATE